MSEGRCSLTAACTWSRSSGSGKASYHVYCSRSENPTLSPLLDGLPSCSLLGDCPCAALSEGHQQHNIGPALRAAMAVEIARHLDDALLAFGRRIAERVLEADELHPAVFPLLYRPRRSAQKRLTCVVFGVAAWREQIIPL